MSNLIEISSVSQWNAIKRDTTSTIFVDFHAQWCGPCKTIAPIYSKLASEYPGSVFLRVDVDAHRAIAQKYQISAMPTFIAIRDGKVLEQLRGADPQGLRRLVQKHHAVPPPSLPPNAQKAKDEGNDLYKKEQFAEAVAKYTEALKDAPSSALLLSNRSAAYLKAGSISDALRDALDATQADDKYAKGWLRYGEARDAQYRNTQQADDKNAALEAYERAISLLTTENQKRDVSNKAAALKLA